DGEYDHPLTGLALLELGRLAADRGDVPVAMQSFAEASYSGYYFSQPEVVEDALREATSLYIQTGGKGVYPPLAAAADWARSKRVATLQATALLCTAENAAVAGDAQKATTALAQAMRVFPRKELAMSRVGARLNYVTAQLGYQRRQPKVAEPALTAAMTW